MAESETRQSDNTEALQVHHNEGEGLVHTNEVLGAAPSSYLEDAEDTLVEDETERLIEAEALTGITVSTGNSSTATPLFQTPPVEQSDIHSSSPETGSFHTPDNMSENSTELDDGQPDISVEIPDLDLEEAGRPIQWRVRGGGEEEGATASSAEWRREYVIDQPKLLLNDPPVEPHPEKQPIPPLPIDSVYWASPPPNQTTRPPEHSAERKPSESSPLLPGKQSERKSAVDCNCCTIL